MVGAAAGGFGFTPAGPVNVLSGINHGRDMLFSPIGQENSLALSRSCFLVHHFAFLTIIYNVYDNKFFVTPSSQTCMPSRGPGC
jgi:hypothetical protein